MARINTKELLKEYILRQLGAPILQVELHDDHLEDVIDSTIKEFSEFAYDGELEEAVILQVSGKGDYVLPNDIQAIMKVAQGGTGSLTNFGNNFGAGFTPNIWSEQFFAGSGNISGIIESVVALSSTRAQLDKFFGDDLAYSFNSNRKILRLFEPYSGKLLIYYAKEYIPESVDYIYDQTWVKKMCTARARLIQSTTTGKYSQQLVGGGMINYSDMRSLAESEIAELKEDLQLQYAGPAPMLVG